MTTSKPLLILIAGPYRSGTGDDPELMASNLRKLEEAAWPIFRAGHVPMIGEWVALPVLHGAGGSGPLDPVAEQIMYPTAQRLLQHCDAVLRLPGASTGADQDVAIARDRGLPVWFQLEDVPGVAA
ncbi:NUDIX hydrolase [Cryptosporangium arvum]|uniref:NUDIX hydrolase n=1 Tax=Cryptosporangium arvum TaxID=80871 RepID=UPI0004AEAF6A|nr:NUDIX hydrolase [Cryptosporangium arvum]